MGTRVVGRVGLGLALLAFTPWLWAAGGPPSGQNPAGAIDSPNHGAADDAAGPDAGAEAHGPGDAGVHPLNFKTDLAIWTAAVFLAVLFVLWKFAWGPIASGLAKREQGIADQIASAERTHDEARQLLADYRQKLAQSEDEVRQMLEEAKRDAHGVGQQIVDKAKEEAQAQHRRALAEIDLATSDALKELAEKSATLAVELAGKIVDARLDPAAHTRLIEQAVARFSRNEPGNN